MHTVYQGFSRDLRGVSQHRVGICGYAYYAYATSSMCYLLYRISYIAIWVLEIAYTLYG